MAHPAPTVTDQRVKRLPHLLALLRIQPLAAEDLLPMANRLLAKDRLPEISLRTLQHDLEWMQTNLGREVIERLPRSALQPAPPPEYSARRWFYRLNGSEDLVPVSAEVCFVSEMEALALRVSVALLAGPLSADGKDRDVGPLASALKRLIGRMGLMEHDGRVPEILAVTQSPPQPYDPRHALTILRAIRCGDGLTMDYQPLGKPAHQVTAQPVRVVLVDGEPYLWAWDGEAGRVKNYKLSRIATLTRRESLRDVPHGLATEVSGLILGSFRGVSGGQQRGRVVLRVNAEGVLHLRDRKLGTNQVWEDLPEGGARVSFNTGGLDAVKHWLLQYGAQVVVESPERLVTSMREEIAGMARGYGTMPG